MKTKEYKLTDVCDFQGGTQPPKEEWIDEHRNGYVRMLQIRDFTQNKIEHIGYVKDTNKLNKCNSDDILIGRYGASVGKILTGLAGAYNVAIIKTIPNEKLISKRFLYYLLNGTAFQNFILSIGARAAQAGFNKNDLSFFKFHIPTSLDDQDRLANILEKANNLIEQRKKSIALLDEITKMQFLKIFGDPVKNEKLWHLEPMNKVIKDIISGTSYGGEEKKILASDELGVLKISAISKGNFASDEFKAVKKSFIHKPVVEVKKGMFLLSRANTKELIAACCIVPEDHLSLFIPDKLWWLVIDYNEVNPIYLNYLFKNESYRNLIRKEASGGHDSMLNISMKKFRELELPQPDIAIQNQFAQIVEQIAEIRDQYERGLQMSEELSKSLSKKILSGKLEINVNEFVEEDYNSIPEIEINAVAAFNKELRQYHESLPFTGAPNEIDNKIRQMETELKIRGEIPFWDEYVKYRIVKGRFTEAFTFDQLWQEIIKFPFETVPQYDDVVDMLYEWLDGKEPFIKQNFNENTRQIELTLNEIATA